MNFSFLNNNKNNNFINLMFNNNKIINNIEKNIIEKKYVEKEDSSSSYESVNSDNVFDYANNINDTNDIIINIYKEVIINLNCDNILKQKNNIMNNLKKSNNIFHYNIYKNDIQNLNEKIKNQSVLMTNFLKTIKPYLKDYLKMKDFNKLEKSKKDKIIYDFYKICKNFCNLKYIKPYIYKKRCINCESMDFENKKNLYICRNCGLEENIHINTIDFTEDNKQINDKDKETFTKALLKFQGKNNEDIPEYVLNKIYNYCDNYDIKYDDVKKQDMYTILQQLGFPNYYEDINLILFKFNKTPLPDLSKYEEKLKINYMLGENVYEKIKIDRKSSLNIQYLLFKHLELLEYPCTKDEFKIIETREILIGYDNIWKAICEKNNWVFIPTI